jgi:hypothetical protein
VEWGEYVYYAFPATAVTEGESPPMGEKILFAPSPFRPGDAIRFTLPAGTHVELSIYDIRGRLVRTLVNEEIPAGPSVRTWDGTDRRGNLVSSGLYLYRLDWGKDTATGRVLLVR